MLGIGRYVFLIVILIQTQHHNGTEFHEMKKDLDVIKNDLVSKCYQTMELGSVGACSGIFSTVFSTFLEVLRRSVPSTIEDSFDAESWHRHCEAQKQLNDYRSPLLCAAAAFAFIPFQLKNSTPALHTYRASALGTGVGSGGNGDGGELELIIVTIDSNYKSSDTPTYLSAWYVILHPSTILA